MSQIENPVWRKHDKGIKTEYKNFSIYIYKKRFLYFFEIEKQDIKIVGEIAGRREDAIKEAIKRVDELEVLKELVNQEIPF